MGTLEIIITILSVLLIVSCVGLYNVLNKYEEAEDTILSMEETLVLNKISIQNTIENMRAIDSKGGFESDDEVGGIFDELKAELELLGIENMEQKGLDI